MIFVYRESRESTDSRPITGVSLGWVFLNEVLSSRARLRFPSRLRFSTGRLNMSRNIQRTGSV
jgi:hypothetical protein